MLAPHSPSTSSSNRATRRPSRAGLPALLVISIGSVLLSACGTFSTTRPAPPTERAESPLQGQCEPASLQPPNARALALAQAASVEHAAWGAPTLDAHGRLIRSGDVEADDSRRTPSASAPWQRVLAYWSAVPATGDALPEHVRFGALRPANRHLLTQALNQASDSRLAGLGVGPDQGLASHDIRALDAALARVAVIDTPWSAAFISWLAQQAGLRADEFAYSEAHADYAARAWSATQAEAAAQPSPSALRACDVQQTPPRVGDLVCQARGRSAGLDSFAAIGEALQQRLESGRNLPMHCDVVTQVDAKGFETVGGNVLDAVTLRRLDFAPGQRTLDPSYLPGACEAAGTAEADCPDRHMSRQPWTLLLQWR